MNRNLFTHTEHTDLHTETFWGQQVCWRINSVSAARGRAAGPCHLSGNHLLHAVRKMNQGHPGTSTFMIQGGSGVYLGWRRRSRIVLRFSQRRSRAAFHSLLTLTVAGKVTGLIPNKPIWFNLFPLVPKLYLEDAMFWPVMIRVRAGSASAATTEPFRHFYS